MGGKAINPTTGRNIRVPDDRWERFGQLVGDTKRSEVLNQFMAAMVGEPGTKMPRRADFPSPPQVSASA
jgi:hypothetical protein